MKENDCFQFRQFTVHQDKCAMKVGTDGTLLGCWVLGVGCWESCGHPPTPNTRTPTPNTQHPTPRILDIGTGTGLIALIMAQRFPDAHVTGIDIDPSAVLQARDNADNSPFADRVSIIEADVRSYEVPSGERYDAIVVNPPYFVDSLTCPDRQRTLARHTSTLTYRDLMEAAARLLADDGELSIIIPFDCKPLLEAEAALAGFFKSRECAVRTTPRKPPRRYLLAFRRHAVEQVEQTSGVIEEQPGVRSDWYTNLTKDFYL